MADPNSNATPVGNDAGTLAPDAGKMQADISDIESSFEPRIEAGEQQSQAYESQAVSAEEQVSQEAEKAAGELAAEDQEMQHWVDHTPTRQAAYATSMHAAPVLAILTALGGRLTKLNGMQMLAATNGIVQGLNESSEKKYQDSMNAWNSAYEKMRDHQRRLADAHKLMLDSYRGRADAYQKASDAARRLTGDILDDKQRKIAQTLDTFKAQSAAWDKIQRINVARQANDIRLRNEISRESHWKEIEKKTAGMPPEIKSQIAAEGARRQNAKSQIDADLKVRGQVSGSLDMPADVKTERLKQLDDEIGALTLEENRAISNADAIVAGFAARGKSAPTPNATPPAAAAPPNPRQGTIDRSGKPPQAQQPQGDVQLSPKRMQLLEQHKGQPVKWADGEYIMDADGTVRRVQ